MKQIDAYLLKWRPKRWAVLECCLTENKTIYRLHSFSLNKKGLHLGDVKQEVDLEQIKTIWKHGVIIWITGKGVLHQRNLTTGVQREGLEIRQNEEEDFVSLMKKDVLQRELDCLESIKSQIIDVFVGASSLKTVSGNLTLFGGYVLKMGLPVWEPKESEKVNFHGDEINSQWLGHVLISISWIKAFTEYGKVSLLDYNYQRVKRAVMKIGFPALLGLLLINFLIYEPIYKKGAELSTIIKRPDFENWQQQQEEWQVQQSFVRLNQVNEVGKMSWMADQLFLKKPKAVLLSKFEAFYPDKKLKQGKHITWSTYIKVKGSTNNSKELELWIAEIEHLLWIERVELTLLKSEVREHMFEFNVWVKDE